MVIPPNQKVESPSLARARLLPWPGELILSAYTVVLGLMPRLCDQEATHTGDGLGRVVAGQRIQSVDCVFVDDSFLVPISTMLAGVFVFVAFAIVRARRKRPPCAGGLDHLDFRTSEAGFRATARVTSPPTRVSRRCSSSPASSSRWAIPPGDSPAPEESRRYS